MSDPQDEFEDDEQWVSDSALQALNMERSLNPNESEENLTRRLFRENSAQAAMRIINTALHSGNERIALDASKYVVERVLGRVGEDKQEGVDAPLETMLKAMNEAAEAHANRGV